MSMSLEQRRTEVIDMQQFPAGKARLAKASSRYDHRFRYWVVEILPARYVDHALAEHFWRVAASFPVSGPNTESAARAFYQSAWLTLRALGHQPDGNEGLQS